MSRDGLIDELGHSQSLLLALAEEVDETTFRLLIVTIARATSKVSDLIIS